MSTHVEGKFSHVEGKFSNGSWNEERYAELENGGGLSQASVTQAVEGGIEGEGSVEWLMCYRPHKTADFVGLQRIYGRVEGRTGSFVLQSNGVFDGSEARGSLSVIPGSGTDQSVASPVAAGSALRTVRRRPTRSSSISSERSRSGAGSHGEPARGAGALAP